MAAHCMGSREKAVARRRGGGLPTTAWGPRVQQESCYRTVRKTNRSSCAKSFFLFSGVPTHPLRLRQAPRSPSSSMVVVRARATDRDGGWASSRGQPGAGASGGSCGPRRGIEPQPWTSPTPIGDAPEPLRQHDARLHPAGWGDPRRRGRRERGPAAPRRGSPPDHAHAHVHVQGASRPRGELELELELGREAGSTGGGSPVRLVRFPSSRERTCVDRFPSTTESSH